MVRLIFKKAKRKGQKNNKKWEKERINKMRKHVRKPFMDKTSLN